MTRYQWLTLVTAVATLALIAVGAVVRTTQSGLGCPDWPLCHGRLIPPAEQAAIIEYTHRSLASVVGVLVIATAAVTLRTRRHDTSARALAVASLPLLGLQAWLGKVTVERELPAEIVTFHLGTALILFAVLSLIAAFAFLGQRRERVDTAERRSFQRVAIGASAVTAVVLLIGAYVVGSEATTACTTWPSCAEAPVPFVDGGRLQSIHWLHRITVLGGLAAVAVVAMAAANLREPSRELRRGGHALVGLYALQIAIGALNVWSGFAAAALVAHLAAGSAIWALLVLLVFAGRFRPATAEREAAEPAAASGQPSGARA